MSYKYLRKVFITITIFCLSFTTSYDIFKLNEQFYTQTSGIDTTLSLDDENFAFYGTNGQFKI